MGSIGSHKRARCLCFGTVALAALLLLGTQHAPAQVLYGSIVGNVTDSTQAAVPEATVTIIATNTGQSWTVPPTMSAPTASRRCGLREVAGNGKNERNGCKSGGRM